MAKNKDTARWPPKARWEKQDRPPIGQIYHQGTRALRPLIASTSRSWQGGACEGDNLSAMMGGSSFDNSTRPEGFPADDQVLFHM